MGKTQIRDLTRKFNLRTPVCKKNQIERSDERQTAKETGFVYYSGSSSNFIEAKTCLSWLNRKRVLRRNSRHLNRLIPINERKGILKRKSDQESRSEKSRIKSEKKKNDEQADERTFVD